MHYVKANGRTNPKVFKLTRFTLDPRSSRRLTITVKLADLSTRKHHPGRHTIDLLVNSRRFPLGRFVLMSVPGG